MHYRRLRVLSVATSLFLPSLGLAAMLLPVLTEPTPPLRICGEVVASPETSLRGAVTPPAVLPSEALPSEDVCRFIGEDGQTEGKCFIVRESGSVATSCIPVPPRLPIAVTN